MPSKSTVVKIGVFAGLGTGIVCLVDGLLWDLIPINQYQGMFWLSFMPLILFFMREPQDRKYLVNMLVSFVAGLLWGLVALAAIATLSSFGVVPLDIVIDLVICGLIVLVHKGLLGGTPLNAVVCVFLGFAETLGCMTTSFTFGGQLVAPGTLNGLDLFIIFVWGAAVTFALSWLCDVLIGKFVFKGKNPGDLSSADDGSDQR